MEKLNAPTGDNDSSPSGWLTSPTREFEVWLGLQLIGRRQSSQFDDKSVRQYTAMFGRFCRWLGENQLNLVSFDATDFERFLSSVGNRGGEKAAPSTIRRYLKLIEKVLDYLQELGLRHDASRAGSLGNIARDLLVQPRYRANQRPAPVFLNLAQSEQYIRWVLDQPETSWTDRRDKALRLIFSACGVTVEEARQLRLSDVQVRAGEVVEFSVHAHGFVQARHVPVATWARPTMLRWLQLRETFVVQTNAYFLARASVTLIDEPGTDAIGSTDAFTIVQEAMRAIGHDQERQGPHTLRHTFTARQLLADVPKERISKWLGLLTTETVSAVERQLPSRGGIQPA